MIHGRLDGFLQLVARLACRLLFQCAEVFDKVRRILELISDNPCLWVMFAYMVTASRIPDPLLEICALNNVGLPVASCNFELDGDSLLLENYILQSIGTHKILQKYKHKKCIKQERHRYTWFTQFGLRPPSTASPSFLLSSKMKRHNLQ